MLSNKALIFSQIPEGVPVAGVHLQIINSSFNDDESPPEGGFTARNLYASFDPYLRNLMVAQENMREYPPFPVGSPVVNSSIIQVLKADGASGVQSGDILGGMAPIQQFISVDANSAKGFRAINNPFNLNLEYFLGPLGMPGLTAYSAFYEVAKPRNGEIILISAATGAVGQCLAQLAKREGLTVLGVVGSDVKVKLLTDLGFDGGFNYNNGAIREQITKLAPGGIDIYHDSVGGQVLEAAIYALKDWGRIVACGAASQYSLPPESAYGIRNTTLLVGKRIRWQGFTVFDEGFGDKYAQKHQEAVQAWIHEGTFKPVMSITHGIENAAHGLVDLISGRNVGKAVLNIAAEHRS